jgi:hypothetical protein
MLPKPFKSYVSHYWTMVFLIVTISKNGKKPVFLYAHEISYTQIFPVKQKNCLHRYFGAAS